MTKLPVTNIPTKSEVTLRLSDKLILELTDTSSQQEMSLSQTVEMLIGNIKEMAKGIEDIKLKDEQIKILWCLLDDISTAGDMYKPEINNYFDYVNDKCEERSKVADSDGYTITIKSERPVNKLKDDK